MINWSKEIATKNYCGYCNQERFFTSCDGSCFKNNHSHRVDHLWEMIQIIPDQINQLEQKLQQYKDEFKNIHL